MSRDYHQLARTEIGKGIVSTILLECPFKGCPFETLVFRGDGCGNITDYGEVDGSRWHTLEEATEGHKMFCRWAEKNQHRFEPERTDSDTSEEA